MDTIIETCTTEEESAILYFLATAEARRRNGWVGRMGAATPIYEPAPAIEMRRLQDGINQNTTNLGKMGLYWSRKEGRA